MQSQADSFGVDLFGSLQKAKELKEIFLVLMTDSKTGVFYLDLYHCLVAPIECLKHLTLNRNFINKPNNLANNPYHPSFLRKLNGI